MINPIHTPVLLIVWRRPHTTQQVIDAVRQAAPTRMFVACDGPNRDRPGEAEKVAATRALIETEIDWPCELQTLYSETNQGCRLGVSRAITWFFEQVEEGIILEDDCVPHPDFFPYCAELLDRYRHDERVWSICGSNFQLGQKRGNASYYFSIYADPWGWATWKRAWKHYPKGEDEWSKFRDSGKLEDIFLIPEEREYWRKILDRLFIEGIPNTWDYQWFLVNWMNFSLHIRPNVSLISNIGFGDEATHTFGESVFANVCTQNLEKLTHPSFIIPDRKADEFAFLHRFSGISIIEQQKYRRLYPWILRWRSMKSMGFIPYAVKHIRRFNFLAKQY